METDECWRPVPGFELIASVSSLGRIQRLEHSIAIRGRAEVIPAGLVTTKMPSGHPRFHLEANGVRTLLFVRDVVLGAFVGPCPDGHRAKHRDGDIGHCALANLYYTPVLGLPQDGLNPGIDGAQRYARLGPDEARFIAASPVTAWELAQQFHVSIDVVRQIRQGRTWKAVTADIRQSRHEKPSSPR